MPEYRTVGGREPGTVLTGEDGEAAFAAGRAKIVPSSYRVLAGTVHGVKAGEIVEVALSAGQEKALLDGGALELNTEPQSAPEPGPRPVREHKRGVAADKE